MDLPRLLARGAGGLLGLLLLAGCGGLPAAMEPPLPTVAVTADAVALQSFVPTERPPSPTPAPTLPTSTPAPTETPTPTRPIPTETPDVTPTATFDPARQINGIPFDEIAVMPPGAAEHVREIAARGQELGRNARAFSKLGDSAVLVESNLTRFDNGPYDLGPYAFLEPAIEHFEGSWSRYGAGARVSLTTVGTFDPMWANPNFCLAGEHLLECEIRLHNPAVLLIRLGTNDGKAELYSRYMAQIIEYALERGIIPVLGTKADRFEGDNSINEATRRLAAEYRVPLWEFDRLAETLPERGLSGDRAHLTITGRNDYTDPVTFTYGYPVSDLSALVILDQVREILVSLPASEG